ncbi:MAG: hypothetical protein M0D53_11530 [Flavobacterium sp. JAD_PAG50586_2]|nr:MAG: hypothetical protein M0D53_11530 [Flavobacterium sp. JAD_PAG50586_2]
MKKIIITFSFFAFGLVATAQQDNLDQLQQQPPRDTQVQVERSVARDAKKVEEENKLKQAEAEKVKAQAQNESERKKVELEAKQEKQEKDKSKKK